MVQSLEIPELKSVIVGELCERGEWILVNVTTNATWPVKAQKVSYRGEFFWIIPVTKDAYPAIAIKLRPNGPTRKEAEILLMRFLSVLSWVERQGYQTDGIGGGNLPRPMGRSKEFGFSICEAFELDYLPEPSSEKAKLALALMREGRSLNHPGYAFLSFYRVLEVAFPNGRQRQAWIETNVETLADHRGKEALKQLVASGVTDIGGHLYESGRCAIAHAREEPIIDPDDPSDFRRLWQELPIMQSLAELAIEQELGIKTTSTIYREHLYELAGFKSILGQDIVEHLVNGIQITDQRLVDIPTVSISVAGKGPYPPLSGMTIKDIGQDGHDFHMHFASLDDITHFHCKLDVVNERLVFDIFKDIYTVEDASVKSAIATLEVRRFCHDYFCNGKLNIHHSETGELISRKSAYIPLNMYADLDGMKADLAWWEELIERRRERDRRYGNEVDRFRTGYSVTTVVTFNDLRKE